jgi:mono/diheme cytochrome c family protein
VRDRGAAAAIVGCLLAALLGGPGCRPTALPETGSGDRDVAAGRRIYERKCASCHNGNGDGRTIVAGHFPYANLTDGRWRTDGSPAAIENQIRRGKDPMPKFQGKLTDEEIRQTVAYVYQLSHPALPAESHANGSAP